MPLLSDIPVALEASPLYFSLFSIASFQFYKSRQQQQQQQQRRGQACELKSYPRAAKLI